ncbi:patatin-like phospholipase family protein [Candidatus Woesearchaeota archaeon]|nr:patatin-like phospholipase family protein [Candidatus Woesearchaeota archaeon]
MKVGLILGGGGAKAYAHVRYLEALDELGVRPDVIAGTSMGALIGALYAGGMSARSIRKKFHNLKLKNFIDLLDITFHTKSGIIEGRKVMRLLEQNMPVKQFSSLKIPLQVVATDFHAHRQVIISSGKIVDAVQKSIAMPGVFEPVEDKGRYYIDGCIVDPVPFDALAGKVDKVIAIDPIGEATFSKYKGKPGIFDVLSSSYIILQQSLISERVKRYVPDLMVNVQTDDVSIFDFHRFDDVMEMVDTRRFKHQVHELILTE